MISSSPRPLPENTQHSQQTNIHALGGIRTQDFSRRAATDLRLRPRGHWDRRQQILVRVIQHNSPKIRSVGVNVFHTHMIKLIDAVRMGLDILKLRQLRKVKLVKIGSTLHDFMTEYRNIVSVIVVEYEVKKKCDKPQYTLQRRVYSNYCRSVKGSTEFPTCPRFILIQG